MFPLISAAATPPDASAVIKSISTRGCKPSVITGEVHVDGFTGRFTIATDPRTRTGFFEVTDAGPGNFAVGVGREGVWVREPDGTVHDADFAGYRAGLVSDIYWASGGLANPCWPAHANFVGQARIQGKATYMPDVIPEGGKSTRAWITQDTHRLLQWIRRDEPGTATVSYATSVSSPVDGSTADEIVTNRDGTHWDFHVTSVQVHARAATVRKFVAPPSLALTDASIDCPARRTTVIMRVAGQPYVDVFIDGKGPFNFLVDTGGSLQLAPSTVTKLKLPPLGAGNDTGIGGTHISFPFLKLPDLQIGAAHVRNLYGSVYDLRGLPAGPGKERLDGIIGYELIARFVTTFDYVNRTLTLAFDAVTGRGERRLVIPFALDHTFPVTSGRINGVRAHFWIDTGSNATITLTKPFAAAHDAQLPGRRFTYGTVDGIGGSAGTSSIGRLTSVEIGPMILLRPVASYMNVNLGLFSDAEIAANLGDPGFYSTALTFDYRHRKAWIVRINPAPPPVAEYDYAGVSLKYRAPGEATVNRVIEGSPGWEAGLEYGDTVKTIDGQPVSQELISLTETNARSGNLPRIKFVIDRAGRQIPVTVQPRNYLD
jgi:hypothetical protein